MSASCAQTDPELFFPGKGGSGRPACQICRNCQVLSDCQAATLQSDLELSTADIHGVSAGLTPAQRKRMRDDALAILNK